MGSIRYSLSELPPKKEIDTGQLLYVSHSAYEGEWQSISHIHFFTEIFFITGGTGKFFIENQVFDVKQGNLVVVNQNIAHSELSDGDDPLEYIVLGMSHVNFRHNQERRNKENNIDYHLFPQEYLNLQEEDYRLYDYSKHKEEILFLLKRMIKELEQKKDNYMNIVYNLYEAVLVYIMRSMSFKPVLVYDRRIPKELARVKRYIDNNYSSAITLDYLVDIAHMNKYYLSHEFKKTFGISPIKYLISRRIQISKELLRSTDYTLVEVANTCGFSSQSYFNQCFIKNVGMTPTKFRELLLKNETLLIQPNCE